MEGPRNGHENEKERSRDDSSPDTDEEQGPCEHFGDTRHDPENWRVRNASERDDGGRGRRGGQFGRAGPRNTSPRATARARHFGDSWVGVVADMSCGSPDMVSCALSAAPNPSREQDVGRDRATTLTDVLRTDCKKRSPRRRRTRGRAQKLHLRFRRAGARGGFAGAQFEEGGGVAPECSGR